MRLWGSLRGGQLPQLGWNTQEDYYYNRSLCCYKNGMEKTFDSKGLPSDSVMDLFGISRHFRGNGLIQILLRHPKAFVPSRLPWSQAESFTCHKERGFEPDQITGHAIPWATAGAALSSRVKITSLPALMLTHWSGPNVTVINYYEPKRDHYNLRRTHHDTVNDAENNDPWKEVLNIRNKCFNRLTLRFLKRGD